MGIETALAVSAGGSILGGLMGASSSEKAAKAQIIAAQIAAQQQQKMFDKQVELQEPFRQGGLTSQNRLMTLLGLTPAAGSGLTVDPASADYGKYARDFGMADFQADPGYDFRMSEGMKALERSAAARGGLMSGSMMKGIQRFGQDLASNEYQNAFNRYQVNRSNQLNPLQSLMGSGQTSANTLTSAAGQLGQGLAQSAVAQGAARASGYMNQANALNNALQGVGNAYMMNNMMSRFAPAATSFGGAAGSPYAYGAGGYTGMGPFV
jgi:hypothetical protein